MPSPTTLLDLLEPHGEQHLLAYWDHLSVEQRSRLQSQLMAIDWREVAACKKLVEAHHEKKSITKPQGFENTVTPRCHTLGAQDTATSDALSRGHECLRTAQVGAILMAGGQGTRLGFDGPKGTFPIATVSKATLFDVLLGHLSAIKKRFGSRIPLAL